MKIEAYKMLSPGTTRGAKTDRFYRWAAGQVYNCPADCPEGEFSHMDPANCLTIHGEEKAKAPKVVTADIEAAEIETRPVAAKRKAKK